MKRILILAAALLVCASSFAQVETWFCSTPGKVLTYAQTNAGKAGDTYTYHITGCTTEDEKTTISFNVEIASIKGIAQEPVGCNVWTAEGYFHTNARAMMGQYGPGLSVRGHGPILPEDPKVGEDLGDCSITIESLGASGHYSNVRFTGQETVETPAGSFDCWVLEYDYVSQVNLIIKIKQVGTCKMWMKKGVGVVKNVLYDKKGKPTLVQELIKFE